MRIVVAGASGLIGTALSSRLSDHGHDVVRLVRRAPSAPSEAFWDPHSGELDEAVLDDADAVVNLCGAGIGDRPWTRNRMRLITDSRLQPTRTLTAAMRRLGTPPPVFVSQSASGYYGTGATGPGVHGLIREDSSPGDGFLSRLCVDWEKAAHAAPEGVRVVTPRTGVVLSRTGGAMGRLMPLLKVGLGGPLGNGRQRWPWITLEDEAAALEFLLTAELHGAVNVCAPETSDVNAIIAGLASALHRPAVFRVPAFALKLVMGRLADELVLADQPMDPTRLAEAGFQWTHPSLKQAADWVAGTGPATAHSPT